jgi:hypothetical protein
LFISADEDGVMVESARAVWSGEGAGVLACDEQADEPHDEDDEHEQTDAL